VAIGDVSNDVWVVPLLVRSALEGVSFQEVYGFRGEDAEKWMLAAAYRLETLADDPAVSAAAHRWRLVPTPHGPHTTSPLLIRMLAAHASAAGMPISIHVAESEGEVELIRDGSGPFPDLLREREMWDPSFEPRGHTPVEHLDRLGALTAGTLAVHCVHLTQADHSRLQMRGATMVACPRSNRRLGVGTAPVRQLLGQGIPVALGTDSLASVPDLDLLAEMAALIEDHPQLTPRAVLRMATLNGAAALGLADRLGSIEPGKSGRLVVVPLGAELDRPATAVCSNPAEIHALEDAPYDKSDTDDKDGG
jgi:cytosine/adenosine deaminase-related metal-dependent hydrolase